MAIADSVAAAWALAHEATMKPLGVLREGPRQLPCGGQSPELLRKTNLAEKLEGSERSPGRNRRYGVFFPTCFLWWTDYSRWTEGTARAIEELPVQSLRIAPDTVSTLARLGVVSVSQLLSLPRSGLATRLGA